MSYKTAFSGHRLLLNRPRDKSISSISKNNFIAYGSSWVANPGYTALHREAPEWNDYSRCLDSTLSPCMMLQDPRALLTLNTLKSGNDNSLNGYLALTFLAAIHSRFMWDRFTATYHNLTTILHSAGIDAQIGITLYQVMTLPFPDLCKENYERTNWSPSLFFDHIFIDGVHVSNPSVTFAH